MIIDNLDCVCFVQSDLVQVLSMLGNKKLKHYII